MMRRFLVAAAMGLTITVSPVFAADEPATTAVASVESGDHDAAAQPPRSPPRLRMARLESLAPPSILPPARGVSAYAGQIRPSNATTPTDPRRAQRRRREDNTGEGLVRIRRCSSLKCGVATMRFWAGRATGKTARAGRADDGALNASWPWSPLTTLGLRRVR